MKSSPYQFLALAVIAVSVLAGCATTTGSTENYRKIVSAWVGHTEEQLESSWGMPQSSTALSNGGTMLEYIHNNTERAGYHGMATIGYVCYTDFYVSAQDQIYRWSYRSNSYGGNYQCGDSL